ncbi:hypothetical protein GF339_17380 [candidate division KSB3 bacterium]|uniref:PIN domain-containing protein n=1 Tax=candidate division KSB3 bacterium TaxID=2044937 RepID=A0A9D5JYL0_9BACT|nr:hypothetical protein [candidate division KSB3 bacterium]MBD3326361.1 hypothetical protein [candidate division KSB3 bacterium]
MNENGCVLDTDILIAFLRGKNPGLKQKIEQILQQNIPLFMSLISLGELYLGAFKSDNTPKNLSLVNSLKVVSRY